MIKRQKPGALEWTTTGAAEVYVLPAVTLQVVTERPLSRGFGALGAQSVRIHPGFGPARAKEPYQRISAKSLFYAEVSPFVSTGLGGPAPKHRIGALSPETCVTRFLARRVYEGRFQPRTRRISRRRHHRVTFFRKWLEEVPRYWTGEVRQLSTCGQVREGFAKPTRPRGALQRCISYTQ